MFSNNSNNSNSYNNKSFDQNKNNNLINRRIDSGLIFEFSCYVAKNNQSGNTGLQYNSPFGTPKTSYQSTQQGGFNKFTGGHRSQLGLGCP